MRRLGLAVWLGGLGACGFDSSGQASGGDTGSSTGGTGTASASASTTMTTDVSATGDTSGGTTTSAGSDGEGSSGGGDGSTSSGIDTSGDASTGVGPSCDVDNGGCDADATCTVERGVVCTCNDGFVGDGLVCAGAPTLQTIRTELPCTGGDCFGGATCYTDGSAEASAVLAGEAGIVYDVTLDIRGVLEHKEYAGGQADGMWSIGGDADPSPWNEVTIEVSDPPALYHPNNGTGGVFEVFLVELQPTVPIAADATVTVWIDGYGNCSIDNSQGIVVPGVEPAPQAFDGQFVQVDLLSATIAR